MTCNKCGKENEEGSKFCKHCGHSLIQKRSKKQKKRNFIYAIVLVLTLLGVGVGSAQLMADKSAQEDQTEPPKQEKPAEKEPEATEEPKTEEPGVVEKIEEPEETVPAEEQVAGTVTKVENVVPPSEQTEKVEPKKKEKTAIIKESQQKVYTIMTEGGQGSGFLFSDTGMVVTNAHAVAGFTDVVVRNINGQDHPGTVVGISAESDIALIHVEAFEGITPLPVEMEATDVGTEVIALGSPAGMENTASIGYLTGIDRDFYQEFTYEDIYQMDAKIAPGSSGGPLVDATTGKVIGINSLVIEEGDSIGFSIPMYSMHDQLSQWVTTPMSAEEVAALFKVYDDFSGYEDEDYEYDVDLEMKFDETNLSEFIGDFRYYYETALKEEDFFYVQNLLVYQSDIYNGISEYIADIAGQGMEFNFTKLEISSIEILDDHAVVQTEEAFDFKDASGKWSVQERSKTYTIVMDEYGFYYISDIVNKE
ncbi:MULTISPECIES: trypsin-like peptidase domain-containing protein [unclassified Planococcus (in: firmicutes)]|uniref:trypsin-like peptidase domain-containing protein n=1 Tax=unclassified Planococcus (in: firmicutes) TaxID=2662419 RepID=UPI0011EE60FC|nr:MULTISPECIES: trypsin-like peptidase domain-containing protein [unclassified Planococcus (in: firmicutes)]KAA0958649.1 trypsin-like serine protease [Planococcus sp. ANT_H30]MDJ0330487.1 trypsin-like peptidase domain-containing protein [Planococcus sp. S3-L1]